ncbi:MAG: hypothetical protein A3H98_04385 [Bacteroidetes bacterium RIFCSPLOWO2_02_FULL_36_8]|nr:MAG: hypothetical protein A3H98_04385 [Bacteroidetes bacterium RIFCSPLOWO2_02_FULL_36_8]OFY68714.1 MAG: hypothetical protein A3G23_02660 [Bacteroidetes bacterium RIFCSPLOWO2_12_FULL_37_12]
MSWFDLILLFILALAGYKGYKRGFIREVLFLSGLIISCVAAWYFKDQTAQFLIEKGVKTKWLPYLSFILVFIALYLLFILAGNFIKKIINLSFLGMLDNILGCFAGIFLWTFLIGLFLLFINHTIPNDFQNSIANTTISDYIRLVSAKIGNYVLSFFPQDNSFYNNLKELFKEPINSSQNQPKIVFTG